MTESPLSPADLRCLTQLGVMASGAGLAGEAQRIFDGLVQLRPQRAYPWIGLATVRLDCADPEGAAQVLERGRQVLAQAPASASPAADQAELACWHGLALHFAGRNTESRQALTQSLAGPPDTSTHALARRMLGLAAPDTPTGARP
jgi:hypothetical protein